MRARCDAISLKVNEDFFFLHLLIFIFIFVVSLLDDDIFLSYNEKKIIIRTVDIIMLFPDEDVFVNLNDFRN